MTVAEDIDVRAMRAEAGSGRLTHDAYITELEIGVFHLNLPALPREF
jgi:hypothetical protein